MLEQVKPLEHRRAALEWYVDRRLKQGFTVISQSETAAELHKNPGFPAFLHKEQTIYVVVDELGRIYVRKSNY